MKKILTILLSICLIFSLGLLVSCTATPRTEPSFVSSSEVSSEEISPETSTGSGEDSSNGPQTQTYKISIETKEGGNIMTSVSQATAGTVVTIFVTTNNGYDFVNYLVNGVAQSNNTFVMPEYNVIVSAEFQPKKCMVVFSYNYDGASFDQTEVAYGQQLGQLPTPIREGYKFDGWFTEIDGGTQINATTVVNGNETYYAKWTINQITATFDGNGGTPSIPSITKAYNTAIGTLPTATNGNLMFLGWFTAKIGGTKITADTKMPANNVTYYAQWDVVTYTITYDGNGATSGSMETSVHTCDVDQALTTNGYTKNGYTFAGWATTSTGSVAYTNGATVKNLASTQGANVTLYAKWTANSYNIKFDANNGTGTMSALATKYDAAINLTTNAFTRVGYTFSKWNTKADGTGTAYNNGASVKNLASTQGANVTLYAQWTANTYTVTYIGNGSTSGSMTASTHTYDVAKTLTANGFVRAYVVTFNYNGSGQDNTTATATYTFNGWATSASGSVSYADKASVKNLATGGNYNLYANWTNGSVTLPTPTRTGYTFGGWYKESGCTTSVGAGGASYTPTVAITLYAKWTPNTYQVKYNGNNSTSGNMSNSSHTYDVEATLTNNAYVRKYTVTYNYNYTNSTNGSGTATYTFNGWNTSANGGGTAYANQAKVKNLTTSGTFNLFAQWTAGSVTLPNPTRLGYVFGGWYQESGCTTSIGAGGVAYTPTATTTIYAKWTPLTYSVKYDGNGSTSGSMTNSSHTYDTAKALTSNSFKRAYTITFNHNYTGSTNGSATATYTFSKWNTLANGTGTSYTNEQSVSNLTTTNGATVILYAQWTSATITLTTPTREGYTFGGWYKEAACTTSVGAGGEKYTPTVTTTIYAKWTPITYTIAYNANGGTGTTASSSHTYDTAKTLTAEGFTRAYTVTFNANNGSVSPASSTATYTFKGWSTSSTATSATYTDKQSVKNIRKTAGTTTLYAVWGSATVTLPTPTRAGHTFNGWYTAASGGTKIGAGGATYTPTANITIYAQWTVNSYTATFDANGGSTASPKMITKNYGVALGTLPTSTKTGYNLVGWFTSASGGTKITTATTMPASNVTYYAHWEEAGLNSLQTAKFRGPNASNKAINGSGFTHTKTTSDANSVYLVNDLNGNLVSASDLRFETEIMITSNNIGDAYPKIGIAISTNAAPYNILEGRFIGYYFYLDLSGTLGQNGNCSYAIANKAGTNDGWLSWDNGKKQAISNNYSGEWVKFAILKEDGSIKFSLNGTVVHTISTTDVAGNAYVSILGIGCEYQVRNSVCSEIEDSADDPVRVLILGNSLVFFNNLPTVFENVARSAGKKISVSSVTRGSATISDYASRNTEHGAKAYDLLESQKFDYVIVEPSRRIVPAQYDTTTFNAELAAARTMKTLAQNAGAQLLLYAVWGDQDDIITAYDATNPIAMVKGDSISYPRKEHVKFLQVDVNEYFASQLGLPATSIIKAGYAFENHYDSYPTENLYNADQRHPNVDGTYLTACTFFATIYNQTPVGISYTAGSTIASKLQQSAKATVIDKKVPVLVTSSADINVLIVGSGLLNDYNLSGMLPDIVKAADGKSLYVGSVLKTNFVFNALKADATDYGLREALSGKEWDYIVLQISRRTTPNGVGIEASELAALKAIYPTLHAETPNIYLMALNGDANPAIYTTDGGATEYTKTANKETLTAAQATEYYAGLATSWATEVNKLNTAYKCKAYQYGRCYVKVASADRNKATVGYLQAASLYMALFGKTYPDTVTCLNSITTVDVTTGTSTTISMTAAQATTLKGYAKDVILDTSAYDINVLFIGASNFASDYDFATFYATLVKKAKSKTVNVVTVKSSSYEMMDLTVSSRDYGLRTALAENKFDYIIIQISRRLTINHAGVISNEFEAFKSIYPTLHAETPNVYLFSPGGEAKQTVFSYTSGSADYTKVTGVTAFATQQEACQYYSSLAYTWVGEVNKLNTAYTCKLLDFATASAKHTESGRNKATVGYLMAVSIYMKVYGAKVPTSVTELHTVGTATMDATMATTLKGYAESVMLGTGSNETINVLYVGASNFASDYNFSAFYATLINEAKGKTINFVIIKSGSYETMDLATESTDYGLRSTLAATEFHYIIVQISRRVTVSGTTVIAQELAGLKAVYPTLHAETPNVYIFSPSGTKAQSVFSYTSGATSYSKVSGSTDFATEAEACQFYSDLVKTWVTEVNALSTSYKCKAIDFAGAYISHTESTRNVASVGYLMAVCIYVSVYNEAVPSIAVTRNSITTTDSTGATVTHSMSEALATKLKGYAEINLIN